MKLHYLLLAALVACGGPKGTGTGTSSSGEAPLPLWPKVKKGVLPNGLTYYVLPHGKPEKRAFLWLAVNAGSVQEDDDQRGLAHFVEHMAFNGTKRFPKAALVNYLESIGMKFGPDLNAYTTFDETVYQLQVPTDDPKLVAKGFEILHDWAQDISFDAGEVDKERGVVLEEWRRGRGAQQRLLDKLIEVVFGDSRYAKRLPIGLPEILKGAPRDALVRYYKDWYRPDLMAIVAVGDFDPATIEKQIVESFGDLKKPDKPRARPAGGLPKAAGTRIAIETDEELPVTVVAVGNLIAHRGETTKTDHRRAIAEQLYQQMLNERMQSIARRPDAPFAIAAVIIQSITREADAFARFAVVKGDAAEAALRSLFAEVVRIEKHGFVQSELDRARTVIQRGYEQIVAEAATRDGRDLTAELVRNFLEGEFVVGPEREKELALEVLPKITIAELNTLAKSFGGAENRVIAVAGPKGKPLPTKEKVLAIVGDVEKETLEPWKDATVTAQLMTPPAWPGTVTKEIKQDKLGVTEWTLSNGVRVIVKPTDFEKDAVTIEGGSPGGTAMASAAMFPHARFADEIIQAGGVGELDVEALGKVLAGKRANVGVDIGEVTEGFRANGSARDIETMLQLIHLRVTAPRRDEEAFKVWKTNTIELMKNQSRSPEFVFEKQANEALWQKHPRRVLPEIADIEKVDLDKAMAFYQDRFSDVSDFTFVIVGEVDLAKLKPMVEAYLGSMPGKARKETEKDIGAKRVGGVVKKTWNLGQDQDKAQVELVIHGDEKWSRDKERDMYILDQVLSIKLRETLREALSGVYGVGASGQLARRPREERVFSIEFTCAPDAVDKLINAAFAELDKVAKEGVDASTLDKVKQAFTREREVAMRTNRFWVDWLGSAARFGDDPLIVLDPAPALARMTSDNVKAAATRFVDRKKLFQAVMLPGKK